LNNFKTEPNATENCETKKFKKKLRSLTLPEAQEEKKKKKEIQPKKQDSARQSIIIKTT